VDGDDLVFLGVSTDSRKVTAGELFVALRGERFDGHDFAGAARERGAAAAVVDVAGAVQLRAASLDLPFVVVADTRAALGDLAADWRSRFALPVIGVTGSNGKTTSKEMIAGILRAAFGADSVLATTGNLNNDIGLPLTLFGLDAGHRAAVIEMGMSHPGEIAALAHIARPTVALLTNAQRAHLEGMGTLERIAAEKSAIFAELDQDGVAVFNAGDPWAGLWRSRSAHCRRLCFSLGGEAEVRGRCATHGLENHIVIEFGGERIKLDLQLPGMHNARNALAAAAAALAAGAPLTAVHRALSDFRGIPGRLQCRAGMHGARVLDDSYNANPDSLRAAIDVLAANLGRKVLVLGDMGETGEAGGQFHDEIGGYAKSQGIDRLLAFGESSALAAKNFGAGGEHFRRFADLAAALPGELTPETIVLVKGSRFMRMERVLAVIAPEDREPSS
jgi:UDP-N-acetylmuramoyl-tripeptide--D-alanyl-D-alanine ligase